MRESIKYICYYDTTDAIVGRNYVLAATNKLNYIWSVINRAGYDVEAISVSSCVDEKWKFAPSVVKHLNEHSTLHLFPSFGGPKVIRVIGRYWLWICFFFWFLFNVRKGEKVIVYHSLGYCKILTLLKRITGCRYIGEIEEIYQDVTPQKKSVCLSEYEFIEKCDAYIFPTHLLNSKLNASGKPYVLVHGIYTIEPSRNVKWDDDDIHVVYAGTFDPNKGGAAAAAATAAFLPKGYHIHICGFGNQQDTDAIIKFINETNEQSEATVTYDGLMKEEKFIKFLQKCQIGLSTQNPYAAFNATSFPSKILTYLSNGLNVVSIRIPAIEFSGVGDCISYYDIQEPREIAQAIMTCKTKEKPEQLLKRLDEKFEKELKKLL